MISSDFRSSLKLSSNTAIGKEELKKLNHMITQLLGNHDSFEFRSPVDWKGLGIMDYPEVVKYPMDLGTVKDKLKDNLYNHIEDCLDDIQLVWDNCKNYNAEGSWIFKLAEKLEKHFKNMIKNYIPSIQFMAQCVKKERLSQMRVEQSGSTAAAPAATTAASSNSKSAASRQASQQIASDSIYQEDDANEVTITVQDRLTFAEKVKQLPTEQLSQIVFMIQNSAANAFKDVDKDKCQILVEQIDPDTFKKINQQRIAGGCLQIELWNITSEPAMPKRIKH